MTRWRTLLLAALAAVGLTGAAVAGRFYDHAVTATTSVSVQANQTIARDLGTAAFPAALRSTINYTSGTGTGQVDVLFSDTRTIAASAADTLDLSGVLLDGLGNTVTFAKVKSIFITAASGNTNNVLVGAAGTNSFAGAFADVSDISIIKPGGWWGWGFSGTGFTVTNATGDLFRVANSSSGTGVTYSIIIIGTSA